MRLSKLAWAGPVGLLLLALVPVAGATAPVAGVVTTCASTTSCTFVFNTSAGTGWATTTSTQLSFQLPGEAVASYNLTYSTYVGSLIGTYTYWTVGNFLGTDANTGKVVYGTTNTNYTITCHGHSGRGGGCTYTYTTDNGTIVFHLTQAEFTSTSVSCSPSSILSGSQTICTVKVVDLANSSVVPTGKVHLSSAGTGSFANHGTCTLSLGQCSVSWRAFDNTIGSASISASFAGNAAFYKSSGSTSVTVTGD
ncbi:MAG TPA: hypothetical protein VIZ68_08010 [Thermoplasmata archaeon]